MEHSDQFEDLASELVHSGAVRMEKSRVELLSDSTEVQTFCDEVGKRLSEAKELSRIQLPTNPTPLKWSLLCGSAYSISSKGNKNGLSKLCCTVVNETRTTVLDSRKKLLTQTTAARLRLSIWLTVNQWLSWNPSGIDPSRQFSYWDFLPDQISSDRPLYSGEKAATIRRLFEQDARRLAELGDLLTTSPALCNNPDSLAKNRVLSAESKLAIDGVLDVSTSGLNT